MSHNLQQFQPPFERDVLARIGSGCVVSIGFGAALLGIAGILGMTQASIGVAIGFFLFGGAVVAGGVAWLNYIRRVEVSQRDRFEEKSILKIAAQRGGVTTAAQLALETPLTIAEVDEALERLCKRGVARVELDDDGTVYYRFTGLLE